MTDSINPVAMTVQTGMCPCHFTVIKVRDGKAVLEDAGGGMSITNAAEYVVEAVYQKYGEQRIFYYDSEGRYDELVHDDGQFSHFRPAP